MSTHGWFAEDCPARGPALSHAHDAKCEDGHPMGVCCHCEESWASMARKAQGEDLMEHTIARRLHAMGLINVAGVPVEQPVADMRIEPKMRTGFLDGPAYGPGRGDLSPRQKNRLNFIVWRERFFGIAP